MGENVLGKQVRHYRDFHKLTMEELGALFGKGHSYVSQVEAGTLIPSALVLDAMARALDVSTDTLLGRDGLSGDLSARIITFLSELAIEDVEGFLDRLRSLPASEQQWLARMVRLSAAEHGTAISEFHGGRGKAHRAEEASYETG